LIRAELGGYLVLREPEFAPAPGKALSKRASLGLRVVPEPGNHTRKGTQIRGASPLLPTVNGGLGDFKQIPKLRLGQLLIQSLLADVISNGS
jgi:hypothetical protein